MSSRIDSQTAGHWTAAVLVTLAVAAVLRFVGLGSGLWFDEIVTLVKSARLPLARILTEFPDVNAHPLYSVLAHASLQTFGDSAWALRLPAAVFGVASVGMVYVLGSRLLSRPEAWAGAALLATSYHHIWFSQNARGYTLLGFLTLLATLLMLRAAETARRGDYALYALTCAAGAYTHLTMVFVVAGHAVVVLGGRVVGWRPASAQPIAPLLLAWTGAGLLSAIAYAPYLSGLLAVMSADAPRQTAQVATASWALGEAVRQLLSGAGVPAALAIGAFAALGAMSTWRGQPLAFAVLVAPGVITAATIVVLGQPLRPRFVFFLAGAAVIFAGRGIGLTVESLVRRIRPGSGTSVGAVVTVTVVLIALSATSLMRNYRLPKQDFEGAVRFLEAADARGTRVVAASLACLPLGTYFAKEAWPCLKTLDDWHSAIQGTRPLLVVHTLTDYVSDPALGAELRTNCVDVARFPGTLGNGDVVVCEPRAIQSAGLPTGERR